MPISRASSGTRAGPGVGGVWRCAGLSRAWARRLCHCARQSARLCSGVWRGNPMAPPLPVVWCDWMGLPMCAQRSRSRPASHWLTHSAMAVPVASGESAQSCVARVSSAALSSRASTAMAWADRCT